MRADGERLNTGRENVRAKAGDRRAQPAVAAQVAGTGGISLLSPSAAASLQRAVGNAAFTHLVGQERHEHGAGCGHGEPVQRSASDEVGSVVRSGGSRLDPGTRAEMESRFGGEDFSDVTIHTGAAARRSAEAVGAAAYTTGTRHVVFRDAVDKKTLAHELEHVRQQRAGTVAGTPDGNGLRISDPSDAFEKSAERKAEQVMRGPAEVQRSAAQESLHASGQSVAAAGEAIQRMAPAKKKGNPTAAPAPSVKTEYEKARDYFSVKFPEFESMPDNKKDDILGEAGIHHEKDLSYSLEEIEAGEFDNAVQDEIEQSKHASGYAVIGGGSSDWASGAISTAHSTMRKDPANLWGDSTSLHHKLSRSQLSDLFQAAGQDRPRSEPFFAFVKEMRSVLNGSTASDEKVLHNMPANLEMGPSSDKRVGDPGAGADFNFTAGGAMTPRSTELNEALKLTGRQPIDWEELAGRLREAQKIQDSEHSGALVSPPVPERWTEEKGGKWSKREG